MEDSKNHIIRPLEELNICTSYKNCKKAEIESVKKSIAYGKPEEINYHDISTTLIERQNLNLRQDNKRLSRKTISYSKKDEWLTIKLRFI